MPGLASLRTIRSATGPARVTGLPDAVVERFLATDPDLATAIEWAEAEFERVAREYPEVLAMDEEAALLHLQTGFTNFYPEMARNPFVALSAKGPWLITLHGAVIHDSGGYGMLGFGHAPAEVLAAIHPRQVMANVMTANVSQLRLVDGLRATLGHTRDGGCPFDRFLCMNSGSEAMAVAARIADAHAKEMTDPGGRHEGKRIVALGIVKGFHGRTTRPARVSHSTQPKYQRFLASFRNVDDLWTVPANDVGALREAFARAERENVFIEAMYAEPVQGEGAPGRAMSREFYDVARELTLAADSLLVIDSIQAGIRAWGVLSVCDYPGFADCAPPDIESWSKALNAGQYPLSVLGLTARAAGFYRTGIYGNTMTTNPRALDVACAVLGMLTPALRTNIREQGCKFVGDLQRLQARFPDLITAVAGTGLLFCAELNAERIQAIGPGSAEERCRFRGVGIIHGGKNALRFTPHFRITDAERALLIDTLADVLAEIQAEIQSEQAQPA